MTKPESDSVWASRKALLVVTSCVTVLGLLGIGTTAVVVVEQRTVTAQQKAYNECQRQYNDAVKNAIKERGEAGEHDRAAIRLIARSGAEMIKTVLDPQASQDKRVSAIQVWQRDQITADDQLRMADEKRSQNPLPEAPQC